MSALFGWFKKKEQQQQDAKALPAPAAPVTPQPRVSIRGPFHAHRVLLSPHVTEKTSKANASNTYTFIVDSRSTKQDVCHAIGQVYGVTPVSVNMIREPDEHRKTRFGTTRRRGRKKAMVILPSGIAIDLSKVPKI